MKYKYIFAAACIAAPALSGCASRPSEQVKTIEDVTRAVAAGDATPVRDKFTAEAQVLLNKKFVDRFRAVIGPLGPITSVVEAPERDTTDVHRTFKVTFEKGERVEDAWFDPATGKIQRWWVRPMSAQSPAPKATS